MQRSSSSGSRSNRSIQQQGQSSGAQRPAQLPGSSPQGFTSSHNLLGHTGWVSSLVSTESVLISASYDTTVRVWSAKSCRQLGVLSDTHTDYVLRLAHAPTAARIVSAGLRGHLHVWDLNTLQSVSQTGSSGPGGGGRRDGGGGFSDDGTSPRSAGPRLVQGGYVNSGSIYALDCTPDGTIIAFNGPEGCVSIGTVFFLHVVCTTNSLTQRCIASSTVHWHSSLMLYIFRFRRVHSVWLTVFCVLHLYM